MIAHALRHWLACVAPLIDAPTDPRGLRREPCPRCGTMCGLHYGRRGKQFFVMHPPSTRCVLSCVTWRSRVKDDALAFFREDARPAYAKDKPEEIQP